MSVNSATQEVGRNTRRSRVFLPTVLSCLTTEESTDKASLLVKYMLFASREIRIGKNCARGLEYKVFPNTDRARLVRNIFIFS